MKKIFFLLLTLGAIVSNLQARKDVHHGIYRRACSGE